MKEVMFKPGKQKILVKQNEVETTTKSGILIPDAEVRKSNQGVVIAVGKETEEYFVGDNIMFGNGSGIQIEVEGESYLLMMEREVYGKL